MDNDTKRKALKELVDTVSKSDKLQRFIIQWTWEMIESLEDNWKERYCDV